MLPPGEADETRASQVAGSDSPSPEHARHTLSPKQHQSSLTAPSRRGARAGASLSASQSGAPFQSATAQPDQAPPPSKPLRLPPLTDTQPTSAFTASLLAITKAQQPTPSLPGTASQPKRKTPRPPHQQGRVQGPRGRLRSSSEAGPPRTRSESRRLTGGRKREHEPRTTRPHAPPPAVIGSTSHFLFAVNARRCQRSDAARSR